MCTSGLCFKMEDAEFASCPRAVQKFMGVLTPRSTSGRVRLLRVMRNEENEWELVLLVGRDIHQIRSWSPLMFDIIYISTGICYN